MSHRSFPGILQSRAGTQTHQLAYRYLADDSGVEQVVTYGQLYARAAGIAAMLTSGPAIRRPVPLLYAPGLEYVAAFLGCLLAGVVAVPAPPPGGRRQLTRLAAIIREIDPAVILTTHALGPRLARLFADLPQLPGIRRIATDTLCADNWDVKPPAADQPAFLQYTSGSTNSPKGVIVSHANLVENSKLLERAFGYGAESHCFTWLPPYHDMGLIGGILQPLHGGFPCTMLSPAAFLQAPLRWLQGITQYGATISGGPDFAYELCARTIPPERVAELDLRTWSVAFNGSEAVRPETLERFARVFAPCGFKTGAFRPCYGLAEGTLFVAGSMGEPRVVGFDAAALERHEVEVVPASREASTTRVRRLVGLGDASERVIVVDPVSCERTNGVGEVWLTGPSCAQGYWQRPTETAEVFGNVTASGDKPYVRTGDLGCQVNGELFITGRLKDAIIIRGLNYYPQDLELTAQRTNPRLRPGCGAAFGVEVDGQERFVIVQEVDRHAPEADLPALIERVRIALAAEHEIAPCAVLLTPPGTVPKTSSGKVQRHACRELYRTERLQVRAHWREGLQAPDVLPAPSSEIAASARAMVLRLVADHATFCTASISHETALASLGLDSMRTVELLHELEAATGVRVSLARFMENPTVGELTALVDEQLALVPKPPIVRTDVPQPEPRSDGDREYDLSWGQRSLLAARALSCRNGGPDLNIAVAFRFRGRLQPDTFEQSCNRIMARHPLLRSTFHEGEHHRQVVHRQASIGVVVEDASGWDHQSLSARMLETAYRPFDLERQCPWRVTLFRRSEADHVAVFGVNHVAADFWSLSLIFDELRRVYTADRAGRLLEWPSPRGQYAEYVRQEQDHLAGAEAERHADYWTRQLSPGLPPLNLSLERSRSGVRTFWGRRHHFALPAQTARALREIGRPHDATLFMVLLAIFQAVLARHTGQQTIAVSCPADNRSRARFADVVGYFVNPLIFKGEVSGSASFGELLDRTRQVVIAGLAHEDYPFPVLAQRLQSAPDLSRPPLAQAMFVLHQAPRRDHHDLSHVAAGAPGEPLEFADLTVESVALDRCLAQFDLGLVMAETTDGLHGSFEYNNELIEPFVIEGLAQSLATVSATVAEFPDTRVRDLPLMPAHVRDTVVHQWNATARDFGRHEVVHELIEEQVERTPEAPAVVYGSRRLTYRQINNHANRLASQLRELGIGPESAVAVCLERSVEMVVALLGIMKAGAAYVPLDPEAPGARIESLIADCNARLVITGATERGEGRFEWLRVAATPEQDDVVCENGTGRPGGAGLVYIIYTSGSTGTPKGAMNTHAGLANRLLWMQERYGLRPDDRVLQKTPYTFDVSVWELFWPLISGAVLVIAPPGSHRDPAALVGLIEEAGVTTVHFVPSMLRVFLERPDLERCRTLRRVICSGEALAADLQAQFFARLPSELHNLYGPTEAAIDVTAWSCERSDVSDVVPIGRPIANTATYILDGDLEPVPPGVVGMLHLGGAGVARGYLGQPALTAGRFIPDLYSGRYGARLFRTGDLGRFLPHGAIEYIGRTDEQVKIRGIRVEPGEIEAVLRKHPAVSDVAVVARQNRAGVELVACVVGADLPADALREYLRSRVPEYLVPARFVRFDELPLTTSGKLDRRALAQACEAPSTNERPAVEPRTEPERRMAALWCELLGRSEVGVDESFFDVGGHSLAFMQLLSRINSTFGVDLPVQAVLETPTIAGMVVAIAAHQLETVSPEEAARLLSEVAGGAAP